MKFEIGKAYHILFMDHSIGIEDDCTTEAYGRMVSQDKNFIIFAFWDLPNASKETRKDNRETFKVIRPSILKYKLIPD